MKNLLEEFNPKERKVIKTIILVLLAAAFIILVSETRYENVGNGLVFDKLSGAIYMG